jgi:hypothetical protein
VLAAGALAAVSARAAVAASAAAASSAASTATSLCPDAETTTFPVFQVANGVKIGSGGLDSVVNGTGGPATDTTDANHAPVDVVSYTG